MFKCKTVLRTLRWVKITRELKTPKAWVPPQDNILRVILMPRGPENHPAVWMVVTGMFWGQHVRGLEESSRKTLEAHNFTAWAREVE